MKKRIFTLMMAFLAVASGAVWGQGSITIEGTSVTGDGSGWNYDKASNNNVLTISTPGSYSISAAGDGDNNNNIQIVISKAGEYTISLNNVRTDAQLGDELQGNLDDPKFSNHCAFQIGGTDNENVVVTLNWTGRNKFWSSPERAGINVKPGATLILNDADNDGTLEAGSLCNGGNGHTYGAGIGGDQIEPNFGTIIIENGNINARCESKGDEGSKLDAYGAGIGGGYSTDSRVSTKGTIIIKGGTIETASWSVDDGSGYSLSNLGNQYSHGAGIGGGRKGTCTNIAILGGNVTANSYSGDDIGVGKGYLEGKKKGGITEGIVIGQWDEKTTAPNIADGITINDVNIVKGAEGSLNGNVTMPKGTQMYVPNETVAGDAQSDVFNAYNYTLSNGKLGDETGHNPEVPTEVSYQSHYYYGPGMSFTVPDMFCRDNHLFLGWYKDDNNLVASNNGNSTFEVPNTALTSPVNYVYAPVWVDNEYSITVKTGTEWKKDGENTPKIAYSPDGSSLDVLSKLNFEFTTNSLPAELTGLQFDGNQLIGTPTLQGADTYEKCNVTASVSLNGGTAKQPIYITITVVDENMINSIEVASRNHVYNGLVHNDIPRSGVGRDYLFDAKMTNDITGAPLPDPSPLREGVHYRVYKYSFNGGSIKTAVENSKQSLEVKDAGTYNKITIEALDAVLTDDKFLPILDQTKDLEDAEIVVAKRPMNIDIKFNKQSLEEDEELTWDDVTITPSAYNKTDNTGIVTSEAEDLKVTGNITYTLNEEGTEATVQISNVKVESYETFKVSNYAITINGEQYTEGTGIELPDIAVPVNPSSTGGGTTDKRYQLFLANKDYLKTDEKTVEYYEDLKLELFSRHNRKYTDAGGSFTIWYEKDGEANVGGYRLFWSKSGEHGDYQEVKFDPVSEYFRIDNVHSDVYVKIYDADGFPVANEAITAQDFRAYAQPNKIIVITPEPTDVQIISMAGAVVAADKVTGQREFANLAEGVYIVRMGETIVKLQVRN